MKKDAPLLLARVDNASPEKEVAADLMAALLNHAYAAKRKKPACLDLRVVGDAEIARLNRRHLGHDGATDVLAFEDGEDEDGRLRLGDIAVSAETARREARERGVEFSHELAFYALHGLYHLLGMRDHDDRDRAAMHREQIEAMRNFGLEPDAPLIDGDDGWREKGRRHG